RSAVRAAGVNAAAPTVAARTPGPGRRTHVVASMTTARGARTRMATPGSAAAGASQPAHASTPQGLSTVAPSLTGPGLTADSAATSPASPRAARTSQRPAGRRAGAPAYSTGTA